MDTDKILRGKKILIVDDEKDVLDALVELLDICADLRITNVQIAAPEIAID